LDGFSIVPLKLVIQKLESEFTSTDNKAYGDALKLLRILEDDGVIFLTLDGQSRGFLAMLPYVKGDINGLGDSADGIILERNGKVDKQYLKNTKYQDLEPKVKEIIDGRILNITVVTDFYEFRDIVDTLVNKQKGWSWANFQIHKQQNRFGKYVVSMIDMFNTKIGEEFSKLWRLKIKNPKKDFKFNRDGHQNFAVILTTLLEDGQWVNNVASKLQNNTESISKSNLKKVFKYTIEILKLRKDSTYISELINWIIFRWVMDGGNRSNDFYKKLQYPHQYSVDPTKKRKLLEKFFIHHSKIKGSVDKPHPLSWMKGLDGKWVRIEQGYSHANENQGTKSIGSRMTSFLESFPWDECISEGIIKKSSSMPSMTDVVLSNDFSDLNGNPVDVLSLSDYDRSHKISKKNGGSNLLDNLVVEDSSKNKARGSDNIDDTQLKLDF